MSYILDALNKAEQKQRHQHPPKLDAVQQIPQHASPSPWFGVLFIIVLINVGALWYWKQQDAQPVIADTSPLRLAALPVDIQGKFPICPSQAIYMLLTPHYAWSISTIGHSMRATASRLALV